MGEGMDCLKDRPPHALALPLRRGRHAPQLEPVVLYHGRTPNHRAVGVPRDEVKRARSRVAREVCRALGASRTEHAPAQGDELGN